MTVQLLLRALRHEKKSGFEGVIDITRHSVLSISQVRGKSHVVQRRKRDINKATDSFFLLSLQLDKTSRISQFGETAELRTGDMVLYSSTDPRLSRQTLADELGVSVRRLNAIFAKEDSSLSVFIREAKFNAVANELTGQRCFKPCDRSLFVTT